PNSRRSPKNSARRFRNCRSLPECPSLGWVDCRASSHDKSLGAWKSVKEGESEQLAPGAHVRTVVEQLDAGEETFRLIRIIQFDETVDLAFQMEGAQGIGHHDPDIDLLADGERFGDMHLHTADGDIHG